MSTLIIPYQLQMEGVDTLYSDTSDIKNIDIHMILTAKLTTNLLRSILELD